MSKVSPEPTPLCSIIIPTYNHAKHIAGSISSALAQTLKATEVVVIDDGSTDDTADRLKQFEGRIVYLRTENGGLGRARNRGIGLSRGKYLQFLDADDAIAPHKLQEQAAFLESYPDVDVVYSDCSVVSPLGANLGNASLPLLDTESVVRHLVEANIMPVHAALVRRAAVVDVGLFDESRVAQEDWDLWLRLAMRGSKFRYMAGDLASYNKAGSLMTPDVSLMYLRTKHLLDKHAGSAALRGCGEGYARAFVGNHCIMLATRAYNNRWWRRSRQWFWRATVSSPEVMTLQFLACIPKAAAHQLMDRLRGARTLAPDE